MKMSATELHQVKGYSLIGSQRQVELSFFFFLENLVGFSVLAFYYTHIWLLTQLKWCQDPR